MYTEFYLTHCKPLILKQEGQSLFPEFFEAAEGYHLYYNPQGESILLIKTELLTPEREQELKDFLILHSQQTLEEGNLLMEQVLSLAKSSEGVTLRDLTNLQVKALVAVLLWKEGAITPEMTIRPLKEWARTPEA